MAWIESHQSIARHPKTTRLAKALGVSKFAAIGCLHMLWWWALDYAQDGDLSRYTVEEIEAGAEWDGEPGKLVEALIQSGYVDADLTIHDWYDYAGKLIEQRERDAARKRESRKKHKKQPNTDVQRTSNGHPEDIQRMSDVPNQPTNLTNQPTAAANTNTPKDDIKLPPTPNDETLDLDTYCREIEMQMVACGANPNYSAHGESYEWVKRFHASGIPIDFIRRGIVQAYARNPEISTFAYCAKVIKDLWAKELAKREPVSPLRFEAQMTVQSRAAPAQPTPGPYVSREEPPELRELEEEERYATRLNTS